MGKFVLWTARIAWPFVGMMFLGLALAAAGTLLGVPLIHASKGAVTAGLIS